jgi:hypothetical protein
MTDKQQHLTLSCLTHHIPHGEILIVMDKTGVKKLMPDPRLMLQVVEFKPSSHQP